MKTSHANNYLESVYKLFAYYKSLGDRTFNQITDEMIHFRPHPEANNIAIIVKHLHGNMLSRWMDFLNSDGEKDSRKRDEEFTDSIENKEQMLQLWEEGWNCVLDAVRPLKEPDLDRIAYIRNEGHSVIEAINRQLTHYAYHVGQIVYIGTLLKGEEWQSLTIPKGKSKDFNQRKFSEEKRRKNFL